MKELNQVIHVVRANDLEPLRRGRGQEMRKAPLIDLCEGDDLPYLQQK